MKKAIVVTKIKVPYNNEHRYYYFNNKRQLLKVGTGFTSLKIRDHRVAAKNCRTHPKAEIDFQVWRRPYIFPFIETKKEAIELVNKINKLNLFNSKQ